MDQLSTDHWLERKITQTANAPTMQDRSTMQDDPNLYSWVLYHLSYVLHTTYVYICGVCIYMVYNILCQCWTCKYICTKVVAGALPLLFHWFLLVFTCQLTLTCLSMWYIWCINSYRNIDPSSSYLCVKVLARYLTVLCLWFLWRLALQITPSKRYMFEYIYGAYMA